MVLGLLKPINSTSVSVNSECVIKPIRLLPISLFISYGLKWGESSANTSWNVEFC